MSTKTLAQCTIIVLEYSPPLVNYLSTEYFKRIRFFILGLTKNTCIVFYMQGRPRGNSSSGMLF